MSIEKGCQADWADIDESRMDIIGQNGPSGEHYSAAEQSIRDELRNTVIDCVENIENQADFDDIDIPNQSVQSQDAHQLNRPMAIPGPDLDDMLEAIKNAGPGQFINIGSYQGFKKQERYKDELGNDHIDDCAETYTTEAFRGAMTFTIDKYRKRLGKKDAMSLELHKIADYYQRWSEYEKGLEE